MEEIDSEAERAAEAELQAEQDRLEKEKKKRKRARTAKRGILQARKGMRQSEKNRIDRINKLHETTRWLPDSAFTTFFGKPAFHAYGKGNVNPTYGGPVYGQYMLSHNINPECGDNAPQYRQTYKCAGMKTFGKPDRVPHLPRKSNEDA